MLFGKSPNFTMSKCPTSLLRPFAPLIWNIFSILTRHNGGQIVLSALVQTMNVKERWVYNFSSMVPHHKLAVLHQDVKLGLASSTHILCITLLPASVRETASLPMGTEGLSFVMACMLRIGESLSSF